MLLIFLAPPKICSMDRYIKDIGILIANVLNAIAVMHIGIKDENALGDSRVNRMFGGL